MVYIKLDELEIKPISDSDESTVIELLTDDIVKRTYMLPDFDDREQAAALFRRLRDMSAGDERFVAGVYLEGRFIGLINETEKTEKSIELGYALLPKFHNLGYCSRVLSASMAYLFEKGFAQLVCGAFEENAASIRVMEKCGMTRLEKVDEIEYRGRVHRCVYYAAGK